MRLKSTDSRRFVTFVTFVVVVVTTPDLVGAVGGRFGCLAVFGGRIPDGPATGIGLVCPEVVGTVSAGLDPPALGAVVVFVAAVVVAATPVVAAAVVVVAVSVVVVAAVVWAFFASFLPRDLRVSGMMAADSRICGPESGRDLIRARTNPEMASHSRQRHQLHWSREESGDLAGKESGDLAGNRAKRARNLSAS